MSVRALKWAATMFESVDVPPAERLVLLALCLDHTDAGGCYPSQDRIAVMTGYRRRHVNTLLDRLEGTGLIQRKTRRTKGKFQKTDYFLFGSYRVRPSAQGDAPNRVHAPAHGDRVRPSAQNRGTYTGEDPGQEKVVSFPAKISREAS